MRVLLAGLFVFTGILLPVILFGDWLKHASLVWGVVFGVGTGLFCIVLCIAALFLFNTTFEQPGKFQTTEEYLKELEEKGLLISTEFQAIRAFQVEEYEDEGPHYFIELADGAVLYLNGQEPYDYELIADEPELNQPRRFPCTEFTLRTHRDKQFVVEIQCRGLVIEPEFVASEAIDFWNWEPKNGQIVTGHTYDEIKQKFATDGEGI